MSVAQSMGTCLRVAALLGAACSSPRPGTAQDSVPWPRADRLAVAVHARLLLAGGDSVRVSYEVTNSSASDQAAMTFVVRTDLSAYHVAGPPLWWGSGTVVQDSLAAHWFVVDRRAVIQPGASLSGFLVFGVGLTEPVAYRVQGFHEPPSVAEGEPVQTPPSFWINSVAGVTVGVAPFPADSSPGAAVSRLAALTGRACDLGWVTAAECGALTGDVEGAVQALGQGDLPGARVRLQGFLDQAHSLTDDAGALLQPNGEFALRRLSGIPAGGTVVALFLTGSGGSANPPTLSLSRDAPTGTAAKYKDSPAINFNGGNPWAEVGTWTAAPALTSGTLTALGDAHVWLGLTNSDDIGTNFDLRVEAYRNGSLIASGLTRCIQSVTRNASQATEVAVPFTPVSATAFNGTTDVLTIKVVTRVGTTDTGELCGGHGNAVGVRVYFDAANRAAQLSATY